MASYSMAGPTTSTPPVLRSFSQRSKSRSGCTEPICTWATFKTLVTWTMKSWLVHDMILISWLILIHNWVGFHPLYTAKNQGYGISWNGLARDSTKKHVLCCGIPPQRQESQTSEDGRLNLLKRSAKTSKNPNHDIVCLYKNIWNTLIKQLLVDLDMAFMIISVATKTMCFVYVRQLTSSTTR